MTTSNAKHTPGPWLAICDDCEPPFVQYVEDRAAHERNAQDATAGNVSFTYIPLSQARAAPELLAALEAVTRYAEICHDSSEESVNATAWAGGQTIKQACAAIARARG